MALHYKQNRTHLKNKRRNYSEVTGNKEVLFEIVLFALLLRSCNMLSLITDEVVLILREH